MEGRKEEMREARKEMRNGKKEKESKRTCKP